MTLTSKQQRRQARFQMWLDHAESRLKADPASKRGKEVKQKLPAKIERLKRLLHDGW